MQYHNFIRKQVKNRIDLMSHLNDMSMNPEDFAPSKDCSLCAWLNEVGHKQLDNGLYHEIKGVHLDLHRLSSEIVKEIKAGANIDALRKLGLDGEYSELTKRITRLLMQAESDMS